MCACVYICTCLSTQVSISPSLLSPLSPLSPFSQLSVFAIGLQPRWEIDFGELIVGEVIGRGGFSEVNNAL